MRHALLADGVDVDEMRRRIDAFLVDIESATQLAWAFVCSKGTDSIWTAHDDSLLTLVDDDVTGPYLVLETAHADAILRVLAKALPLASAQQLALAAARPSRRTLLRLALGAPAHAAPLVRAALRSTDAVVLAAAREAAALLSLDDDVDTVPRRPSLQALLAVTHADPVETERAV